MAKAEQFNDKLKGRAGCYQSIFAYLPREEAVKLQILSRRFYYGIIPSMYASAKTEFADTADAVDTIRYVDPFCRNLDVASV